ncbi:MAG: lipid-A-disaccharide synthase [Alphaproteobacteria bacterium]|nr:lipid-A-disaccharide synthase [Alphaproteobacteria bacterium]
MSRELFLIAGEPSGDAIGAPLIKALKAQAEKEMGQGITISGVGGELMQAQGLETLLPMEELCVMGLWEVIGHLPRLLKLIDGLVEEIEKRQPAVLVTIDLPDFNFRVAKKLKKRGIFTGKIVHYVAPSVWAWRPGRAKKIAGFLDSVLCLFPFEPPHFEKEGLKAHFVGHPLIENVQTDTNPKKFRAEHDIPEKALCVGLLFGSRPAEIARHAPTIVAAAQALKEHYPDLHLIVPTLPTLEFDASRAVEPLGKNVHVIASILRKWPAFAACDVAIAVSGTVGLELALMRIPHIIGYKTNMMTWILLKLLVKIRYAHLGNILLDRQSIPEFLQWDFTDIKLLRALMLLIRQDEVREQQKQDFIQLDELLRDASGAQPSEKAAAVILQYLL